MSLKLTEALYKNGNISQIITLDDINEILYKSTYKYHLYCPYPNCKAHMIYVPENIQTAHFRTWRKNSKNFDGEDKGIHIKGCPFTVEYQDFITKKRKSDPNFKHNISDNHITNVLKRAYKEFTGQGQNPKPHPPNNHDNKNGKSVIDINLPPIGSGTLFGDGVDLTNGREQKIPVRTIESLTEKDLNNVRCIVGAVENIKFSDDFSYINLKIKKGINVSVYFGEYFIVNNKAEYTLFPLVFDYIKSLKNNRKQIICCVIGELHKKGKFDGFNIMPDRYLAFSINNKSIYKIYHEYTDLIRQANNESKESI